MSKIKLINYISKLSKPLMLIFWISSAWLSFVITYYTIVFGHMIMQTSWAVRLTTWSTIGFIFSLVGMFVLTYASRKIRTNIKPPKPRETFTPKLKDE